MDSQPILSNSPHTEAAMPSAGYAASYGGSCNDGSFLKVRGQAPHIY